MRNLRGTFLYEGRCIAGFSYLHYYNVPLKSLTTLTLLRLNMRQPENIFIRQFYVNPNGNIFQKTIPEIFSNSGADNLSFATGIFPDSFKIAKATHVYKKYSKRECSNYRPISILKNLDKIIEKLIHKRLMAFLNDQRVLYKKQFELQKNVLLHTQ